MQTLWIWGRGQAQTVDIHSMTWQVNAWIVTYILVNNEQYHDCEQTIFDEPFNGHSRTDACDLIDQSAQPSRNVDSWRQVRMLGAPTTDGCSPTLSRDYSGARNLNFDF